MSKYLLPCLLVTVLLALFGCKSGDGLSREYPQEARITVVNRAEFQRTEALVTVDLEELADQLKVPSLWKKAMIVMIDDQEIPSQKVGTHLYFLRSFKPRETVTASLRYTDADVPARKYTQRAHAELSKKVGGYFEGKTYIGGQFQPVKFERVPLQHVDHDTYYRFEGPGWESDKVGYRFYLDQRNAIDIFGKKVPEMVLPRVGLEDFDSYHEMAAWGMDIFKVGESLGIGSLGTLYDGRIMKVSETDSITCEIVSDGPLLAQIRTTYYGWKVGTRQCDLESNLAIRAGSRLTQHQLFFPGKLDNLVTGLAKSPDCEFLAGDRNPATEWDYIALWGPQSLAGDNLGIALFYRLADLQELSEDELNYFVILKPQGGRLTYYFSAAWEQEPQGIKTKEEFGKYLKHTVRELNNPVEVIY